MVPNMAPEGVCAVRFPPFLHWPLESAAPSLLMAGSNTSAECAILSLHSPPELMVNSLSYLVATGALIAAASLNVTGACIAGIWITTHCLLLGYMVTAIPLHSCHCFPCLGVSRYPSATCLISTFSGNLPLVLHLD